MARKERGESDREAGGEEGGGWLKGNVNQEEMERWKRDGCGGFSTCGYSSEVSSH